ncbi:MAG: hypothetical protein QM737_13120 [Ferruginibacter sp.]
MKTILRSHKPYVKKIFLIVFLAFFSLTSQALNYYWIGGSGNWTDLNHWATSSGGTTLQNEIPTAVDDVFFDVNSFTSANQTVTFDAPTLFAHDISFVGVANNPTIIFPASGILKIYGSLTLAANMITQFNGVMYFEATNAGQTITSSGHMIQTGSHYSALIFNGIGGSWTLADDLSLSGTITQNNGTLNTNDKTVNAAKFEIPASAGAILNMGASVFNLTDLVAWNIYGIGATVNGGTSVVNVLFNDPILRSVFIGGNQHYYNVNFSGNGNLSGTNFFHDVVFHASGGISGNNNFHDLTFHTDGSIGGNNIYNNLNLETGYTYTISENKIQTINGVLNAIGSCTSMIGIYSDPQGQLTTISHPAGNVNLSYVLLKDISTAGAANFTANNSVDLGGNTGWTFNALTAHNLYWIGNGGDWDDGNHWSFTSGGAPSGCSPTPLDNVFFDANSFSSPGQTVSINAWTAYCKDMDWTGATNLATLTSPFPAISHVLKIYGSLTYSTNMNLSFYGYTYFEATSTGKTIRTNGQTFGNDIIFNGIGGEWILLDELNSLAGLVLNYGTLTTNNQTVNADFFSSEVYTVRGINLGSSVINLYAQSFWTVYGANMTLNCGTSVINAFAFYVENFVGGNLTYYDLNFMADNANAGIEGNNRFHDVVFHSETGRVFKSNIFHNATFYQHGEFWMSNTYNDLNLTAGFTYKLTNSTTQTINGNLNANGNCGALININSSVQGNQANISHPPGAVNISYTILKDINATGGANFTASNSIDLGNNNGWIITSPASQNLYWIGDAGNWSDGSHWSFTSGGSPSGCSPTPLDNVFFDANSFSTTSQVVTVDVNTAYCRNMNWTGALYNPQLSMSNNPPNFLMIYGSLTLINEMDWLFGGSVYFQATTPGQTITIAGKVFFGDAIFNGVGGEWTLMDEFTTTMKLSLQNGTLNTNDQIVNAKYFISNNSSLSNPPRTINMGASVFNLSYFGSQAWYVGYLGVIVNCGTSVINCTGGNTSFGGGGHTYYDLNFTGGSAILYDNNHFHNVRFYSYGEIDDSNTFNKVTFDNDGVIDASNTYNDLNFTSSFTYTLDSYSNQTINNRWQIQGSCVSYILLKSSYTGVPATVTKAIGDVQGFNIHMKDIHATGGALFHAYNSVDLGGNTGWDFSLLPPLLSPNPVVGPIHRLPGSYRRYIPFNTCCRGNLL